MTTIDGEGYTPTPGEMQGAYMLVLIALIQELKKTGGLDGEALAQRLESLATERNAENNAVRLFKQIARHEHDDI